MWAWIPLRTKSGSAGKTVKMHLKETVTGSNPKSDEISPYMYKPDMPDNRLLDVHKVCE